MDANHCLCGQPYDVCKFMIQCDNCKEWFHGSCVYVKEHEAKDLEKFHCPRCQPTTGPSIAKIRKNWHRHNYWEENVDEKPVQAGTAVFVRELKQRHFPSADDEIVIVRGQQLTLPYFVQNGFEKPILIPSKDGLGLTMPPDLFTVNDIMDYVGEDCPLDVIDVGRQEDVKMTMKDWVSYFNSPDRDKIYNVISLEFSQKRLSELVRPPSIVQKLSWVESHWPEEPQIKPENEDERPSRPNVMKYCLMGTEDSYTDFHIDFGGTSVWYHILQGEKVFYLIRPTPSNLNLYERWMSSNSQSEAFFGDQVDNCFRVTLTRGQTLFIPSGWIHAVMTSMDSLVFGGNFLCSMNIPVINIDSSSSKSNSSSSPKKSERIPGRAFATTNAARRKAAAANRNNTLKNRLTGEGKASPGPDNKKSVIQRPPGAATRNPSQQDSVYDFVDSDEDQLIVDEKPKKSGGSNGNFKQRMIVRSEQTKISPTISTTPDGLPIARKSAPPKTAADLKSSGPLRLKLNAKDPPQEGDFIPDVPLTSKNGTLDTLLMACDLAGDPESTHISLDDDLSNSGRASPSTREAIQGMLSMSKSAFTFGNGQTLDDPLKNNSASSMLDSRLNGLSLLTSLPSLPSPIHKGSIVGSRTAHGLSGSSSSKIGRKKPIGVDEDDFEATLKNCHQDKDYIYFDLDTTEEDQNIFKKRGGRSSQDESWSPRARVNISCPKPDRPIREGVRKEAIESGLAAAAAKLAELPPPKRPYHRKKAPPPPKPVVLPPVEEFIPSPSTSSSGGVKRPIESTTPSKSASSSPPQQGNNSSSKKPRKGFATAKQRLGKILKIHKMLH